jgi:hypothetical protein
MEGADDKYSRQEHFNPAPSETLRETHPNPLVCSIMCPLKLSLSLSLSPSLACPIHHRIFYPSTHFIPLWCSTSQLGATQTKKVVKQAKALILIDTCQKNPFAAQDYSNIC